MSKSKHVMQYTFLTKERAEWMAHRFESAGIEATVFVYRMNSDGSPYENGWAVETMDDGPK